MAETGIIPESTSRSDKTSGKTHTISGLVDDSHKYVKIIDRLDSILSQVKLWLIEE